jgi:prepilin-type N-terminal cleavage/methylation domain-containing protein
MNIKRRNRRGVAVIEIMVAMVIFAIALLGAAGMTVVAARRATGLSTQSSRDGIMLQELNKLASVHYDSLAARVGCKTASSGSLTYTRCIAVTDMSAGNGYKRVRLIVTPSTSWARPDTMFLNRAKGPIALNPFGS